MTSTPPNSAISDSWVDLTGQASPIFSHSPRRITPVPFGGEQDYLRMLREAQRESNRSSTKVSPISSALMSLSSTCRNTPSISPKSPPNSPNPELASLSDELKDVYINTLNVNVESDILWDWSSRPNIPQKDWKYPPSAASKTAVRSRKSSSGSSSSPVVKFQDQQEQLAEEKVKSIPPTKSKKKKNGPFTTKEVVYTLLITNLLSILIGAGIGIWLSKRGSDSSSKMLVSLSI